MTTAVVLALPVGGVDPGAELAGLSLALRAVLTLQKEGIERIVLVAAEDRRGGEVAGVVRGDPRLRIPVDLVRAAASEEGLREAVRALPGPILVALPHVVVDPAIYRALRGADLDGAVAVAACRGDEPIGPVLASDGLVDALGTRALEDGLRDLLADGRARRLETPGWFARADTPEGRRRAFTQLFEACRKPVDGVVARHVNRHISIFFSKRLVGTPITPNMMSVVTFLLGIAAAVFASRGGYVNVLVGAFLFQWNSILDGVDGELARVRFQHSKLGQWLDTVSDDLSNVIFYAGLAIGARALPFGRELALAGYVAIATGLLTSAIYYVELVQIGSGDLYAIEWGFDKTPPPGIAGKVLIFFRYVVKKDFEILLFVFLAICGVLPYALPVIAAAQIGVLVAAILRKLRRRTAAA